jgi:hypothetical protein
MLPFRFRRVGVLLNSQTQRTSAFAKRTELTIRTTQVRGPTLQMPCCTHKLPKPRRLPAPGSPLG